MTYFDARGADSADEHRGKEASRAKRTVLKRRAGLAECEFEWSSSRRRSQTVRFGRSGDRRRGKADTLRRRRRSGGSGGGERGEKTTTFSSLTK